MSSTALNLRRDSINIHRERAKAVICYAIHISSIERTYDWHKNVGAVRRWTAEHGYIRLSDFNRWRQHVSLLSVFYLNSKFDFLSSVLASSDCHTTLTGSQCSRKSCKKSSAAAASSRSMATLNPLTMFLTLIQLSISMLLRSLNNVKRKVFCCRRRICGCCKKVRQKKFYAVISPSDRKVMSEKITFFTEDMK